MNEAQMRTLVQECGLDWRTGYAPLFAGDTTNRFAVLIEAVLERNRPGVLTPAAMKVDGFYNWRSQPDRLVYIGSLRGWHQFRKIGDPRAVWCEVLDNELYLLGETPQEPSDNKKA